MKSRILLAVLAGALVATVAHAQTPYPQRLKWWTDARFGMFIHWGPVSLSEQEISWSRANTNPQCPNGGPIPAEEYDNLYKRFNPTEFNAKEWVRIAKDAGMKYMVLTAKHCDGFLLWDSKVSDYNIMHTPFKRDVCKELADAAHKAGMKIGWYFSPMDWKDPDCRNEKNAEFVKRMQAEIAELLTNYGKIDVLWFDWDLGEISWDQKNTYALIKRLQPNIIINNRLDMGPGMDAADPDQMKPNNDFFTPEQWIGGYCDKKPWESCMTISKKNQWAWGGYDDGVKDRDTLLGMLTGCAGGDGNVLLNVGPTPTGIIAPEQAGRLKEIGVWMRKYGESIRGTRGGPFKPGWYGTSTRKGNTIYLHIRDWDGNTLKLPKLPGKVLSSRLLTGGKAAVKETAQGIEVSVPDKNLNAFDTIVALELDRSALGISPVDVPTAISLANGGTATASNVYQNSTEYGPDKAIDGNGYTRWATDPGTQSAWLEVDFMSPVLVDRVTVMQAFPELKRIKKFAIEYWSNGKWVTCDEGKDMGAKLIATFKSVMTQKIRLNITEATDGPTLFEFKVFGPIIK
jgi:alpha-L-fucosidase